MRKGFPKPRALVASGRGQSLYLSRIGRKPSKSASLVPALPRTGSYRV